MITQKRFYIISLIFIFLLSSFSISEAESQIITLNASSDVAPTQHYNDRKILKIRYRKITSNGIGEAIPGIGDEEVAVMDESTVRRNKNSSVIQKGYVYRGLSIDNGEISNTNVVEAKVNPSNSIVTFWYEERDLETMPNKQEEINLSQIEGVNITVNESYSPSGYNSNNYLNYNYNVGNIDLNNIKNLTREQAGIIIANFSIYTVNTQKNEWIYSYGMDQTYGKGKSGYGNCYYTPNTYLYKKSSGWAYGTSTWKYGPYKRFNNMYSTDCGGFCSVMYHWALGLGSEDKFTRMTYNGYTSSVKHPQYLNKSNADAYLKPGDIIYYSGHFVLYAGNGKVTEMQCVGLLHRSINTYKSRKVIDVLRLTEQGLAELNANLDQAKLQFLFGADLNASGLNVNTNESTEQNNNDVIIANESKPIYEHTLNGTLVNSYNDSSIDVKIEKIDKYYVAKIWVKDPSKQVNKTVANWGVSTKKISDMLNPINGAIIGVNGSGFTTDSKDPNYPSYTTRGHYIITNGEVVRKVDGRNTLTSIGITRNGEIKYYENSPYSDIEKDGIYNTFSFGPLLIKDGVEYTQSESSGVPVRIDYDKTKRQKTLVGQVDENNYVLIVLEDDGYSVLNHVKSIGTGLHCKTLYNLDGGGSSYLWFRKGTSGNGSKVAGGSRKVMDVLYFSSLE